MIGHGIEYLFGYCQGLGEIYPELDSITIDCAGKENLDEIVERTIEIIRDCLFQSGFMMKVDMILVIPESISLNVSIPTITSSVLSDSIFLLTIRVAGRQIIHPPWDMSWLDWFEAVWRGEQPHLIVTMPWAQARFLNCVQNIS